MNRKQLILLLAVLLVIGTAGLILFNQHKDSWTVHEAKMGDKALPNFRPNDVAMIHIKGYGELTVLRTNDIWGVAERQYYPASFGQISDLLIKLRDLKVVQAETVGLSDLSRVNLDPIGKGNYSGTLVEFKDAQGKLVQSILLGKKHMRAMNDSAHSQFVGSEPDGRYISLPNDPQDVLLVSNAFAILEPRPDSWLSHDFIKVERIKSVECVSTNPAASWKISREKESATWVLADAKPDENLEGSKVYMVTNTLSSPHFTDIAAPDAPSKMGLDYPKVVTVETFDEVTYILKIGGKATDDSYFMTVAASGNLPATRPVKPGENADDKIKLDTAYADALKPLQEKLKREKNLASWVYLINTWIIDPVIRDRAQLLQGYQEPASSTPAAVAPVNNANSLPGAPGWTPRVIK